MVECSHLDKIKDVKPKANVCEDCIKMGDTWFHLRICKTCGYVGCCDNSMNRHARKHFHSTNHPIIQSIEPGESWLYCYIDKVFIE